MNGLKYIMNGQKVSIHELKHSMNGQKVSIHGLEHIMNGQKMAIHGLKQSIHGLDESINRLHESIHGPHESTYRREEASPRRDTWSGGLQPTEALGRPSTKIARERRRPAGRSTGGSPVPPATNAQTFTARAKDAGAQARVRTTVTTSGETPDVRENHGCHARQKVRHASERPLARETTPPGTRDDHRYHARREVARAR
jgi:hypothetical protein